VKSVGFMSYSCSRARVVNDTTKKKMRRLRRPSAVSGRMVGLSSMRRMISGVIAWLCMHQRQQ
jgi:hypothetical protein